MCKCAPKQPAHLLGKSVVCSTAQWSRNALALASEIGSREATVALGDRALFGRGAFPEVANGADCESSLKHLRCVAGVVAKDAAAVGDFALPRESGRLRDQERDVWWVGDEETEDGDVQIMMEEDIAARGVLEAQCTWATAGCWPAEWTVTEPPRPGTSRLPPVKRTSSHDFIWSTCTCGAYLFLKKPRLEPVRHTNSARLSTKAGGEPRSRRTSCAR